MKKKVAIISSVILAVLIGTYFIGAFYYKDKFLNNVYVNKVNVSGMTINQADKELQKTDVWDKIMIKSDKQDLLEISSKDIDYKYIESPELPKIFNQQNEWKWFLSLFKHSSYVTPVSSYYNKDKVKEMIGGIEELDKEPINAKVVYSEADKAFVVQPHSPAIMISREELFNLVSQGIDKGENEVNIQNKIEQPAVLEDDESLIAAKDKANKYLNMKLKYNFGDREELIDSSQLKDWIVVNESEKQVDIDSEKVKEYVVELAKKYDTFGKSREFKTSTGEVINTKGGTYGWLTHRGKTTDALIEQIKSGESKTIEPIYSYKALIRNTNDIGNSYVEIDLKQQLVSVFVDGELKLQTPTVTGNISKGYNTPAGVFPLNYKERNAVLRGENYASPVKYWMPFNGNIGLHDADWRNTFGGNIYKSNGSHGCINLPPANAKTIFDLIYPGMPVVVH